MSASPPRRGRRRGWAVVLDLALVAAIAIASVELLRPALRKAESQADVRVVAAEALELYVAFERYFSRNREYPNAYADSAFDKAEFEPLRGRGYYAGAVQTKLVAGRADGYDSPDDRTLNGEYWLEMTLASDPRVRFVVARSDDAPLGGGQWLDGAYLARNGRLEKL